MKAMLGVALWALTVFSLCSCGRISRLPPGLPSVLQAQAQVELFCLDTGVAPRPEQWPQFLLVAPDGMSDWHGPYAKEVPRDPWGQTLRYAHAPGNEAMFGIYSIGKDGIDQHGYGDDIAGWVDPGVYLQARREHKDWPAVIVFFVLLVIAIVLNRR